MPIMQTVIQGGGTTPTGTINITSNGTHDVTNYASANVAVPTTAPASYRVFEVNMSNKLVSSTSTPWIPLPAGTKSIDDFCFAYAYRYNSAISGTMDLSQLETISGQSALMGCFYGCQNLTSINLSNVTIVSGQSAIQSLCRGCKNLTSFDFSSLIKITGASYCFNDTGLTKAVFPSLTDIASAALQYGFGSCPYLTELSFPCLTTSSFGNSNCFNYMLSSVTGCTVHFPSNIQSTIGSWSSVTGGFGGTNTTVLFDLPATVTLTGADTVTYTRNPKYDTATALAWKVGAYGTTDFTPAYYTSGTTDPQANDTIYSDAACTTTVTTISSIA